MPPESRRTLLKAAALAGLGLPATETLSPAPARASSTSRAAAPGTSASIDRPGRCEPRYLGYRDADRAKPFASFFTGHTAPPQQQITAAHAGAPVPAAKVPPLRRLTTDLRPVGYSPIETGYGITEAGVVWVAALTRMPRVSAAMWDWWFGWHSIESARYKLWHPDAHAFCSLKEDRSGAGLTDRERYVGNVSYVDEWIGPQLQQLAISFQDPVAHGFDVPAGQTVVYARVGSGLAPVDLGYLAHQVRPVRGGAEMRSRFYLNLPGLHPVDAQAAVCALERGPGNSITQKLPMPLSFGRELLLHCGQEMNHLARFLPELHARFGAGRTG